MIATVIIDNFWHFFTTSAPWLLLGFLLAGLLKEFVPQKALLRFVGTNNVRSVATAALIGAPLPICSCGVIPTAMALHKQGASRGATVAFLIATPAISVTAIILTVAMLGWQFAGVYIATALVVAIGTGLITLWVFRKADYRDNLLRISQLKIPTYTPSKGFRQKVKAAIKYGFIDMLGEVGGLIVLGLLIASIINTVLPSDIMATLLGGSFWTYIIMALVAIPIYICSTAAVPMMALLVASGMAPAGALIFLVLGPAVNIATIMAARKEMGSKTTIVYIGGLIILTFICAAIFNVLGMI